MGFLFNRKKKNKTIMIFDIGSDSVGGAIVSIPKGDDEIPLIIESIRTDIDYRGNIINTEIFKKSMMKALNLNVKALHNTNSRVPNKIVCVLASPWYSLETKTIKIKKESPFVFNKKLTEKLISRELKKTISAYQDKNNLPKDGLEIIENHIMSVLLNGYKVESPLGMDTKSVKMNIITSFSQKIFLDEIRGIIKNTFHGISVSFSSFIIDSYFSVRDRYISPDSYLLLDIGGEITEVGIVSKGILKSILSFPFGKRTFFRYISTKAELDLRDVLELFHLYSSGNLLKEKKDKVEPIFTSAESSWSESFRQCIAKLPYILALPSTIFLTADSDIIDYFANVISNEKFIESMTIEHKCNVIPLKGSEFIKICEVKEKIRRDPFLMIETISIIKKMK